MKKRIKRRRFWLIRPVDGLLPLAFLAGDLWGPSAFSGKFFLSYLLIKLLALCSADGARMAFAVQPSMRQVRSSTTLAVGLQCLGALVAAGICGIIFREMTALTLTMLVIGLLLNIERVLYEYIHAEGDRYSATLSSVLGSVLLLTGILLENGPTPYKTLALTGLSTLIFWVVAVFSCGYRPCKPNMTVLLSAPRAMIYGLTYPALIALAVVIGKTTGSGYLETLSTKDQTALQWGIRCGFYGGYALIAICRTPFRRSHLECRKMTPVLLALAGICLGFSLVCGFIASVPVGLRWGVWGLTTCMMLAIGVVFMLWGNFKRED